MSKIIWHLGVCNLPLLSTLIDSLSSTNVSGITPVLKDVLHFSPVPNQSHRELHCVEVCVAQNK